MIDGIKMWVFNRKAPRRFIDLAQRIAEMD